ncbi:hypothetical protein JCM3775_002266 [Rhodotorula graminis]
MVALDSSALVYKILADVGPGVGSSSSSSALGASSAVDALGPAATSAAGGHGGASAGGAGGNGQQSDAKRQKLLQHARSEWYAEYYVEIACAFLGLLILRNLALKLSRAHARRQRQKVVVAAGEKGGAAVPYTHSALVRAIHAVDRAALTPVPFLPSDWSILRVGLIMVDIMLCLVFSLVNVFYGTSTAKMFADRCGRIATADLPLLFLFVGRNNILTSLTGLSYQSLRFYHIYLGAHSTVMAIIHTFAYVGQYYTHHTTAKLQRAFGELYFKMGIVAVVFMVALSITGLGFIRRRGYQAFLALHVAGAGIILGGCWYHRPNMQDWVMATVGIWLFERVFRISSIFTSWVNMRLVVRAPVMSARATIVDGAIKLSVPFKGAWGPGQHFYISFWGRDFLRRPHLYGQTHPFCAANVSVRDSDKQELRFVLRIHKGITSELDQHIRRKMTAKGQDEVELMVAVEGPFDTAEPAEEYESVLCLAGGAGITHPISILADVCQKAALGTAATTSVRLVWALHHAEQGEWIEETLAETRAWAAQAHLPLAVDLYVTRPEPGSILPSLSNSGSSPSSPTVSPSLSAADDDEKKLEMSTSSSNGSTRRTRALYNHHSGRPDVVLEVAKTVRESSGRTLVVACGPVQLAEDVRRAVKDYKPSQLAFDIAKFDW